jgi:hypothetical protein
VIQFSQIKLTAVTQRTTALATLFNRAFAGGTGGPSPHRCEMTLPSGPSTEGGKLALQHLRLVPEAGSPAVVMGSINPTTKEVGLRTRRYLDEMQAQRFKGADFQIDAETYETLTRDVQKFFADQGFTVTFLDAAPASPPIDARPSTPVTAIAIALGVAAATTATLAYLLLGR